MTDPGREFVVSEGPGGCRHDHGITVEPSPDHRPGNLPGVMLHSRFTDVRLTCGEARHLAWHLMLHAQQAEDDPDPAEVEALAACISDEGSHPGGDFTNSEPEAIARLILRRFTITEREVS